MTAMVTAYQSSVCPDAGREHVTGTLVLPGCHTAGAVTLCSLPGAPPRADSIALSGAARAAKRGDQSASRSIRSIALPPCAMVALEAPGRGMLPGRRLHLFHGALLPLLLLLATTTPPPCAGHGATVHPPSRNAIGSSIEPWKSFTAFEGQFCSGQYEGPCWCPTTDATTGLRRSTGVLISPRRKRSLPGILGPPPGRTRQGAHPRAPAPTKFRWRPVAAAVDAAAAAAAAAAADPVSMPPGSCTEGHPENSKHTTGRSWGGPGVRASRQGNARHVGQSRPLI
jgi:hypothetical protein